MHTRDHIHEETFPLSPERLFSILHTPSAIRSWWGASTVIVMAESGGIWCAAWGENEDRPDYISAAAIKVFEPPFRLVLGDYHYTAEDGGLPFEADFEVEFIVSPHEDGATLKVCQRGFPIASEADDYFEACVTGWKDTFLGIRNHLSA